MVFFAVILGIAFVVLHLKYFMLKRQIRDIAAQIEKLTEGEKEKILDISLINKDIELLAGQFNRYYEKRKMEVSAALDHEEQLKDMIANVTHDLRTPLTVIDGHLQMLKKTSLSSEQQHRVVAALGKAERMKELTEVFYDLTLLDADKKAPKVEQINFSNQLMDFLTENVVLFERKRITPIVQLPQTSVFVKADRSMLERILQNLVINAIRYTTGEIKIAMFQEGEGAVTLQVTNPVRDSSEIDTDRLFDRFYTGDASRANGSSGLGLAVAKLLVEKMNGSVLAAKSKDELSVGITLNRF